MPTFWLSWNEMWNATLSSRTNNLNNLKAQSLSSSCTSSVHALTSLVSRFSIKWTKQVRKIYPGYGLGMRLDETLSTWFSIVFLLAWRRAWKRGYAMAVWPHILEATMHLIIVWSLRYSWALAPPLHLDVGVYSRDCGSRFACCKVTHGSPAKVEAGSRHSPG